MRHPPAVREQEQDEQRSHPVQALGGPPKRGPCCEPLRARRLFFVLAAASILRWAAEFVRAGESLGREPPGVGAIAAPVGELLEGQCKRAFGGVDPHKTARRRE